MIHHSMFRVAKASGAKHPPCQTFLFWKMGTRGLLSPYLIVAVLLVLAVSLLAYTGQLQRFFGPSQVAYPIEVEPVARHIQDCAARAGTEAVQAIASQGGYIWLPPEIAREYDSFLPLDDLNMQVVPFWVYRGRSRIPTLSLMEDQISQYSTNRTLACIDRFRQLGDQYLITPEGNLSISTSLTRDTVYLSITYPLKVLPKTTIKETRLHDFSATVPARLRRTYELAKKIMQYQNKKLAVENLTIDLMTADPSIPFNHLGIECTETSWMAQDIKEHLQEVMAANLLNIRIKNTDHAPFEEDESVYERLAEKSRFIQEQLNEGVEDFSLIEQSAIAKGLDKDFLLASGGRAKIPSDAFEYFHSYWDVGQERTPLSVAFVYYPSFGMDLLATPNQNGKLSSTLYRAPQKLLGFLCLNVYHFTYTLRYPVMVRIHDPASFGGKGLTFDIAFPVAIRNNDPESRSIARRHISDIRPAEGFCTKLGDRFYEVRAIGADEEGYISNAGLDDANISYRCAGRRCPLGTTQAQAGVYAVLTPLPAGCKNPAVIAEKPGYLSGEAFVTQQKTLIPLTKLKTLPLTVKKRPYFAMDKALGQPVEPATDENISLTITAFRDQDYTHRTGYPASDASITLIEGTEDYRMDAVLTKQDRIIGGAFATNITLKGSDVSAATRAELTVIEYRPTPLSDAEEAAMALYLMTETKAQPLLTLQ